MRKILLGLVAIISMFSFTNVKATDGLVAPAAVGQYEVESNDTFSTATVVNQDDTVYGSFSQFMDFDYFKVTFPLDGKANFWLGNIPSDADYDLHVYNENYNLIASSTGTTTSELISNIDVEAGKTFYFRVECVTFGSSNINFYKVRCKLNLDTYSYFCQNKPELSDPEFVITNLDNLYYRSNGNISSETWLDRIDAVGCKEASYAMILRNLGAKKTSSHYDVRTGQTKRMEADPFTVALSNKSFPTITQSNGKYIAETSSDPVYMDNSQAVGGFGRTCTYYSLSGNAEDKANAIAYQLSLNPEGIAVGFLDSDGDKHTVAFTGTTYEVPLSYNFSTNSLVLDDDSFVELMNNNEITGITEEDIEAWEYSYENKIASTRATAYDGLFTVCDPYSTNTLIGNQAIFGNAFISTLGFDSAASILVIN